MARIAVIDDDPVEFMLLTEFAELGGRADDWRHFNTLDAFAAARGEGGFDLVLLDRRIPPIRDFSDSLPLLAGAGFSGPVILMSAEPASIESMQTDGLTLIGPVDKAELQSEGAVTRLIEMALGGD